MNAIMSFVAIINLNSSQVTLLSTLVSHQSSSTVVYSVLWLR